MKKSNKPLAKNITLCTIGGKRVRGYLFQFNVEGKLENDSIYSNKVTVKVKAEPYTEDILTKRKVIN